MNGCGGVTDDGIIGLCSDEYVDNEMKRMGQCKLIHTLLMFGTNVTKKGAKVAIENLPELKKFDFSCCVQILAELRRENLERGDFKTYKITEFHCTKFKDDSGNRVPYESGSLRLASNICPSVNVIHIKLQIGLTDVELRGLLELEKLRELKISGDEDSPQACQITFDGGVIPLLKAFGSSLVKLQLCRLTICVNIRAIAAYCPHLKDLILDNKYPLFDGFVRRGKSL